MSTQTTKHNEVQTGDTSPGQSTDDRISNFVATDSEEPERDSQELRLSGKGGTRPLSGRQERIPTSSAKTSVPHRTENCQKYDEEKTKQKTDKEGKSVDDSDKQVKSGPKKGRDELSENSKLKVHIKKERHETRNTSEEQRAKATSRSHAQRQETYVEVAPISNGCAVKSGERTHRSKPDKALEESNAKSKTDGRLSVSAPARGQGRRDSDSVPATDSSRGQVKDVGGRSRDKARQPVNTSTQHHKPHQSTSSPVRAAIGQVCTCICVPTCHFILLLF